MQIVSFLLSRHEKRYHNARYTPRRRFAAREAVFAGPTPGETIRMSARSDGSARPLKYKERAAAGRSPLLFRLVLFPPFPGREAVALVKRPGEVQLIGVAALGRDGADGSFRSLQLVGGLGEAEAD